MILTVFVVVFFVSFVVIGLVAGTSPPFGQGEG